MEIVIALVLVVVTTVTTFLGGTPEKITHDGSRTGPRVGYQSFCHPEQGFVILENEKMPFTKDDGEQVLWTQGDIDCYKQTQADVKNETGQSDKIVNITKTAENIEKENTQPSIVPSNKPIVKTNTSNMVSISCTTALGTTTEWGNSYEEASKKCEEYRKIHQSIKDSEDALKKSFTEGLSNITNSTFQFSSPLPNVTINPPSTITTNPEPTCKPVGRNDYGSYAISCE